MVQSHFEWRILRFPCGGYSEASMFRFHYYLHTKKMLWNLQPSQPMKLHFSDDFFAPAMPQKKVVQKLAAETIWNSLAGYSRADHDISRTNRNFIIPRFPFKLRRHVDISDWILNWHSVEAVRVRGHSTTTWTEFCNFWTPLPCVDSFYTLSVDKKFFWPPPPLIMSTYLLNGPLEERSPHVSGSSRHE